MRQLGWIVLAFAVLVATHAAVWTHLAERMRERLQQWAVALPVHRVAVEMGPMRRTGYPFSIRWTLDTPKVRANWALGEISALASAVTVSTDIWHPDTLLIDVDGLVFDAYRRLSKDRLHVEALRGSGILGPPKTQEAVKLRFEFFDVAVGSGDPARMQIIVADVNIAKGYLRFSRSPDDEPRREIGMTLEGISSPLSDKVPLQEFGSARVEARFTGDTGNLSLEDIVAWRDAGGTLDIKHLELDWQPIEVSLNGTIALDELVRPLGAGTMDVRGANPVIDRQVALGRMTGGQATGVKLALALMTRPAKDGGEPIVRVPLTAQDGQLKAGPFTILRLSSLVR